MLKDKINLTNAAGTFNDLPRWDDYKKKERLTSSDCWALRYTAMRFIENNFDRADWKAIDDENAFQDSELYLLNFEGYAIDDDLTVRTLFMDENGRILADIYSASADKFAAYLVD